MSVIFVDSNPVAFTAVAVGATLFRVPVASCAIDSFPATSLTFARNPIDSGSFCVPREKFALACRQLRTELL